MGLGAKAALERERSFDVKMILCRPEHIVTERIVAKNGSGPEQ